MYIDLPACISEITFNTVLKDFIKGKFTVFYDQWLAAGSTLDILAAKLKTQRINLTVSEGLDNYNRPLPAHISKSIHALIVSKMLISDYSMSLDHWISAGRTIDYYNKLIKDQETPVTPVIPPVTTEPPTNPEKVSDKKITFLLWKPVSEGGGAGYQGCPVILSKGSEEVGFIVNGKKGTKKGPNNGYNSTDMTTVKAVNLPKNTVVTFYDRETGLPVLFKGKLSLIIADPIKRYEIKG